VKLFIKSSNNSILCFCSGVIRPASAVVTVGIILASAYDFAASRLSFTALEVAAIPEEVLSIASDSFVTP